MFAEDVKFLKCISCGSDVNLVSWKVNEGETLEGKISCGKCDEEWPVINGIPRILPRELVRSLVAPKHVEYFEKYFPTMNVSSKGRDLKSKTAESFGFEWLLYPQVIKEFETDWKRYFNPFVYKEDIEGKIVADIGCGMGKHGYFTCAYGARKFIGVDLSEAVEAMYRNTKKFKPLIIQADIYNLPLKGNQIDMLYCIGVIHHLPDPKRGFLEITSLMKKNSKILIWVYGKRKNFRALYIYNPIRKITTRLPREILYKLCYLPAFMIHSMNLVYGFLKRVGFAKLAGRLPFKYYALFPFSFKLNDSFDVLGTPKQVYYELDEIKQWLTDAKLTKASYEFDVVQGIKAFGIKQ